MTTDRWMLTKKANKKNKMCPMIKLRKTSNMNCNSKKCYDQEHPHTLMQLPRFEGRILALENRLYNGVYSSIFLYAMIKGDLETLVIQNCR